MTSRLGGAGGTEREGGREGRRDVWEMNGLCDVLILPFFYYE